MVPVVSSYYEQLVSTFSRVTAKCCLAFRRHRGTVGIGGAAAFQTLCVITIVALMYDIAQRFDAATTRRCLVDFARQPDEGLVNDSSSVQRSISTLPDELDAKLIRLMNVIGDSDCAEIFLRQYEKFCEKALVPAGVGYRSTAKTTRSSESDERHRKHRRQLFRLCPCVPWQRLSKSRCNHVILSNIGVKVKGIVLTIFYGNLNCVYTVQPKYACTVARAIMLLEYRPNRTNLLSCDFNA